LTADQRLQPGTAAPQKTIHLLGWQASRLRLAALAAQANFD
jgi:hypothetical protein